MELSPKLQSIKAYAENLGLEVEVSVVSERSAYIIVNDPSVSRGWIQIIQTRTVRETYGHSANVAYSMAAKTKPVALNSVRAIIRSYAEDR